MTLIEGWRMFCDGTIYHFFDVYLSTTHLPAIHI